MNKILSITLLLCGLYTLAPAFAGQANQDVTVEKSGVILVKSQRQQKNDNTNQTVSIKKSGGIIVIIQRNINKFKCEDIKAITNKE